MDSSHNASYSLLSDIASDVMADNHIASVPVQPVGPSMNSITPAPYPTKVTLQGSSTTLRALVEDDAKAIWPLVEGEGNAHLFTYLPDSVYPTYEDFTAAVLAKTQYTDTVFWAIVDNRTSSPVGWLSLHRIDTNSRVLEIGNILYTAGLKRTKCATEAIYLMARYVFEDLEYRRLEWKCDNLNSPSKKAAVRYGFTFEGVFRKHMIYKGRSRDTCWFAIVDTDWENVVKPALDAWLDDSNFDAQGHQRKRLQDFRPTSGTTHHSVVMQS
jgi:RimJ/RimL family protein N-acetyltransferase